MKGPIGGAAIGLIVVSLSIPASAQDPGPLVVPPFVQPVTGTPVEFHANRPLIWVFVAPGVISDTAPRYPDPFFKLGRPPFVAKLVPGTYTITTESAETTSGSTVMKVGNDPVHIRVNSGSSSTRDLGTLLLAVGAASALAATVIEVSYSKSPNGISKSKIAIPLFVLGGVGVASGLTLYLTSGTTIEQDGPKPDRHGVTVGVTSRW